MNKHYYHACTRGLEDCLLFSSEADFISGMNRIAFCKLKFPEVTVLAFVLMDNHIHLILYGSYEDCISFLYKYKQLTGIYLRNNHRNEVFLDKMECDAWMIPDRDSLIQKFCYVLRNPLVARMNVTPMGYRWSSAGLMFSDNSAYCSLMNSVGSLSARKQKELFGTRMELPKEWRFFENGMIWLGDYVEIRRMENLFGNPSSFLFSLNKNVEAEVNSEMHEGGFSLPDNEARQFRDTLCERMFGKVTVSSLNVSNRLELAKVFRKEKGASLKQIARLLHLPLDEVEKVFCG